MHFFSKAFQLYLTNVHPVPPGPRRSLLVSSCPRSPGIEHFCHTPWWREMFEYRTHRFCLPPLSREESRKRRWNMRWLRMLDFPATSILRTSGEQESGLCTFSWSLEVRGESPSPYHHCDPGYPLEGSPCDPFSYWAPFPKEWVDTLQFACPIFPREFSATSFPLCLTTEGAFQ